jgi:hypothetical protein
LILNIDCSRVLPEATVLEVGECECGLDGVVDLAKAGGHSPQGVAASDQQGIATSAETAQAA